MSDSILADGSVELFQRWQPGGAQGIDHQKFVVGEQYLFAIALSNGRWEIHAVVANSDPGFELPIGFSWSKVEWFIPCSEFDFPKVEK